MKNIPLITIIGVPNTGKSTLFNRLIGKRKALIHSEPGMTRDIYKKSFEINGRLFFLQDSGGFLQDGEFLSQEIDRRILQEADRSDLVLFLFDGRREMLGYEKDLFVQLKKTGKKILLLINKVDSPEKFMLPVSYYALNLDFIQISAEHNIGIDDLRDAIERNLESFGPGKSPIGLAAQSECRISIVGKPNVGKSSIINRILNDDRVIVSPQPGTTRDSVDLEFTLNKEKFILVDNAGIRKLHKIKEDTESAAVIRAKKDIDLADIIVFVQDLSRKTDQNDLYIAQKILESAKPVILAGNKWDLIENKSDSVSLSKKIKKRFNFLYFAPLVFVSAKTGKNIHNLMKRIALIHQKLNNQVKTSHLNRLVQSVLAEKKLLNVHSKGFYPKFAVVESLKPFFIRFYDKSGAKLRPESETFLKKRISKELQLDGVPIFFKISAKK